MSLLQNVYNPKEVIYKESGQSFDGKMSNEIMNDIHLNVATLERVINDALFTGKVKFYKIYNVRKKRTGLLYRRYVTKKRELPEIILDEDEYIFAKIDDLKIYIDDLNELKKSTADNEEFCKRCDEAISLAEDRIRFFENIKRSQENNIR